ncbi:unnamed protein product [Darwinula stevensoni]|uniref:Uncharacterized protein n=1 Tax=Darwinula stevensoni TaxID=69355 RepID=A0A7R8XA05_9CRUS|nr:unnamed protein product [Darwinula stevensoni]CAG0885051.1 unnamed protein product [Darwinula stevensoni]
MQSEYVEDPSDWKSTQNIIAELFPESDRHGKFFVEAGALDGQTLSKTLYLEKKYGWTGLLVEPNPHLFKKLSELGRNAWLAPYCLSPKDEITHEVMEYMYQEGNPIVGITGGIAKQGLFRKIIQKGVELMETGFSGAEHHKASVMCYPLHTLLDDIGNRS